MYQISFLPWLQINNNIEIGDIKFIPYKRYFRSIIKDTKIISFLDTLFHNYVDLEGAPLEDVTICSYKDEYLSKLDIQKKDYLSKAINILVFNLISQQTKNSVSVGNYSMVPYSSDTFEIFHFNFITEQNEFSIVYGRRTITKLNLEEIKFPIPLGANIGMGSFDYDYNKPFNKIITNYNSNDHYKRILRSIDWFRLANMENTSISHLSKIVMMATAYEILLDISNGYNKKKLMAEYIDANFNWSHLKIETRNTNTFNMIGWWIWNFYDLRNKIVHGDNIDDSALVFKDWISQLIVSNIIFQLCIENELYRLNLIGGELRSKLSQGGDEENIIKRYIIDFDEVYNQFGWVN